MNELFEEVLYGEDYEEVTSEQVTDTSRWHTMYEQVFKKTSDGTFWEMSWSRGSTEYQDDGPEDVEIYEVEPKEVTVVQYFRKK